MTVTLLDSFNRTASDLSASPVGRWFIPPPGGALVSAFLIDGQVAQSAATTTASTLSWAQFYAPSTGQNYGRWSCRARRSDGPTAPAVGPNPALTAPQPSNVLAIGVIARCATNTADRERYWFGWSNETGTPTFSLRLYTNATSYSTVASATAASLGVTMDTNWHEYAVTITRVSTNVINFVCTYDGATALVMNNVSDLLTILDTTKYKNPGIQFLSSSGWIATQPMSSPLPYTYTSFDFAMFDDVQYNDLASPVIESAPAIVAEPTLSALAFETENEAADEIVPFAILPDFGEVITERYFVNRARTEAGYEATFAKWTTGRRLWSLRWQTLSATEGSDLLTAFTAALGSKGWQDYVGPDGVSYTVRFVNDTLTFERMAPDVYGNVTAVFEELI